MGKAEEDNNPTTPCGFTSSPSACLQTNVRPQTNSSFRLPRGKCGTLLDDYSKRPARQRWVIIGSPGLGKSKCAWYRSVLRAAVCQGAACGRSGRGKQNASGGVRAQDGVQVRAGEPQRPQEKCAATDFADSRECCLQTVDNLHCRRHSSAGQFYPDYGDAGNGPCVLARLVTTPTYNKFAKHADRLYIV